MLKTWIPGEAPEKEELKQQLDAARKKLYDLQMKIKEHKLPVLVLFEGWSAAGKGSMIGKVIKNIDPRFFKVATMSAPSEEELRRPFLYRYMCQIPEQGKFTFLDSGWMEQTTQEVLRKELTGEDYEKRIESIRRFERQLTDNGYLVLKFFMQINKEEQKLRMDKLCSSQDTRWRVSEYTDHTSDTKDRRIKNNTEKHCHYLLHLLDIVRTAGDQRCCGKLVVFTA